MIDFKTLTLIGAILVAFGSTLGNEKLNYLIVLADDISANSFGCYGSVNPNTSPNIDKLAEEGVQFTNMFVAQATCAPSRAELYTGLLPFSSGVYTNHKPANKDTKSIVHYLNQLGYRVGLTGKGHVKPKNVYPFEKVKGFATNCNHFGPVKDDWTDAIEFMIGDKEQPFCLVVASTHAHAPWDAGDTSYWELEDIDLPKNLADTPETRAYYREYLAEVREFDRQVGDAREVLSDHGLDKNTVLIILDENGAGMPGGKWTNYDWGVRSACIMKWPEPYQNGFKTDAVAQYCDILPTLIEAAGGEVPNNLNGKSLYPLIKKEKFIHRDYAYFVHNTLPKIAHFSSRGITDGRYKLIWTLTPETPFVIRVINAYKNGYVDKMEDRHVRKLYQSWVRESSADKQVEARLNRFDNRPEFQLFDLDADPEELVNLASKTDYQDTLNALHKKLKEIMLEQNDLGKINAPSK